MAKPVHSEAQLELAAQATIQQIRRQRSFYRPHARHLEMGEITNPHTGQVTRPPSLTKQEFVAECDINNILKQYSQTGILTHISAKAAMGAYTELPDQLDFQESMNTVAQATEAFATLPSKVRARFGNEPSEFLAFMADPDNLDEMRKLGLANPAPRPPEKVEAPATAASEAPKPAAKAEPVKPG